MPDETPMAREPDLPGSLAAFNEFRKQLVNKKPIDLEDGWDELRPPEDGQSVDC